MIIPFRMLFVCYATHITQNKKGKTVPRMSTELMFITYRVYMWVNRYRIMAVYGL